MRLLNCSPRSLAVFAKTDAVSPDANRLIINAETPKVRIILGLYFSIIFLSLFCESCVCSSRLNIALRMYRRDVSSLSFLCQYSLSCIGSATDVHMLCRAGCLGSSGVSNLSAHSLGGKSPISQIGNSGLPMKSFISLPLIK